MSQHVAEVVPVELTPHPDADSLSVVFVGGFSICVRTADWIGKKKGIFVLPDSICDVTRPEFTFLDRGRTLERVKARKLRGVWSVGLLIPCEPSDEIGSDHFEKLGLAWYDQELALSSGGNAVKGPDSFKNINKYDIENGKKPKYKNLFTDNESVYVSEKIHGAFCGITCHEGNIYVKSRNEWKLESQDSVFWNAVKKDLNVFKFCMDNPDKLLLGEAYGQVQKGFKYDIQSGVGFRVFDIQRSDYSYLDYNEFVIACNMYNLPRVPDLGVIPFDFDVITNMAEESSSLGGIREGVVVKPVKNRYDHRLGRVFIKVVSNNYLDKS